MISVIIPTYQLRDSIRDVLKSLENQTYPHFEVVIVNNNICDESKGFLEGICDELDIETRILSSGQNLGAGGGRNYGVDNAKGEIVAFTDDDCIASPNWLEVISQSFENSDNKVIYGRVTSDVAPLHPFIHGFDMSGAVFGSGNCAFLKSFFVDIKGFDTFLNNWAEDFEIGARCEKLGYKPSYVEDMHINHPPKLLEYSFKGHALDSKFFENYRYITKHRGYTYKTDHNRAIIKRGFVRLLIFVFILLVFKFSYFSFLLAPIFFALFQVPKLIKIKRALKSFDFKRRFNLSNFLIFSLFSWSVEIYNMLVIFIVKLPLVNNVIKIRMEKRLKVLTNS